MQNFSSLTNPLSFARDFVEFDGIRLKLCVPVVTEANFCWLAFTSCGLYWILPFYWRFMILNNRLRLSSCLFTLHYRKYPSYLFSLRYQVQFLPTLLPPSTDFPDDLFVVPFGTQHSHKAHRCRIRVECTRNNHRTATSLNFYCHLPSYPFFDR